MPLYSIRKYYRAVLLRVLLVIVIVLLNMYFIPEFGLNGAAIATLIAITLYSLAKLFFVVVKMKLYPFTIKNLVSLGITALTFLYFILEFSFHPIINIVLKSVLVTIFICLLIMF